jgi:hypothetical protein
LKAPFILYWEITMSMTGFLMAIFLPWFFVIFLQDRKAARKEKQENIAKEKAAERERIEGERAIAEDNDATEKLKERYNHVHAMTPTGEEQ